MTRLVRLLFAMVFGLVSAAPLARAGERRPGKTGGGRGGRPGRSAPAARPGRGGPGAKPGKGAPAEGEEDEEKAGTAMVLQDSDAVILRDGTRIDGTVLCAGQMAVTILTQDKDGKPLEKTIPREKVERVIKSADAEFPTKFGTEKLDGHKYLVEAPPEEEEGGEEDLAGPGGDFDGPPPRRRPKAPGPAKRPKAKPTRPAAKRPPSAKLPSVGLPKLPFKLPGGLKVPKDSAKLRDLLNRLKKGGKLDGLLKDPRALKALKKGLKKR